MTIVENEKLNTFLLQIMSDGKYHSANELKEASGHPSVAVKEALLNLLQNEKVHCAGSRWKIISDNRNSLSQLAKTEQRFCVKCPQCRTMLTIQEEYIGMKVQCTCCNTRFYVSTRKYALNEYEAIPEEKVFHD